MTTPRTSVAGGVGKRKTAVAQVRLFPGNGQVIVNGHQLEEYFPRLTDQVTVLTPFRVAGVTTLSAMVKVRGGGTSGQAGAIRHAIARALVEYNEEFRGVMRRNGLLTRDARIKERKKYGLKRARKAPQYTKR
ncbi:MAG: 30S ribosomal protein S9 [Chloroflexota bacterium]|nr:30S ribosomal protein S9 [Dehalococcoidia bacterium]MDW8254810.1 30S ribosomal protein S9 [Chloroflexota bacterium]